jgi:hypothetical protein
MINAKAALQMMAMHGDKDASSVEPPAKKMKGVGFHCLNKLPMTSFVSFCLQLKSQ